MLAQDGQVGTPATRGPPVPKDARILPDRSITSKRLARSTPGGESFPRAFASFLARLAHATLVVGHAFPKFPLATTCPPFRPNFPDLRRSSTLRSPSCVVIGEKSAWL